LKKLCFGAQFEFGGCYDVAANGSEDQWVDAFAEIQDSSGHL
jgi:hypothetical protein